MQHRKNDAMCVYQDDLLRKSTKQIRKGIVI